MKTFQGVVISVKTPKTATIKITNYYKHPLYRKIILRYKKLAAHIEGITVREGDNVLISETRPRSKTKHFIITKVVKSLK